MNANDQPAPPPTEVLGAVLPPPPTEVTAAVVPVEIHPPTPLTWRLGILGGIVALGGLAYLLRDAVGVRGQALAGVFCFFGLVAAFSRNLRAVNWRTVGFGVLLQVVLALLVLKVPFVYAGFELAGGVVKKFITFSDRGAEFVFGSLAKLDGPAGFVFAFKALPPILFVSAFFTVLYHFGILQFFVHLMSRAMTYLMKTSGAETLSVSANVFMGQTEAPLIVKPYIARMTNSELFTLMVSGFAHISGGMMVVYILYGADPVAVLTTSVMACPCSLYLAKLFLPETGKPETGENSTLQKEPSPYANAVDAAAAGTGSGLKLALNVAAMLVVFIAFVAMFDAILGVLKPALLGLGVSEGALGGWPDDLSLRKVFGWLFAPAAFLMGVPESDCGAVGQLLGTKLTLNEHVAYLDMKGMLMTDRAVSLMAGFSHAPPESVRDALHLKPAVAKRSYDLAAFALTGFANFASVGIQLGGIGAMAPERRKDLARLGGRALFVGFTATLLNAAIAGVLL